MKVAYFRTPGEVELREEEIPLPGEKEILVKILSCGICGSDLARYMKTNKPWHRMGHEFAGRVEEAGKGVTRFKKGDIVAGIGSIPCGSCTNCVASRSKYCLSPKGHPEDAFAEYVVREENLLWPVSRMTPEQASLIEPLTVSLQMVEDADIPFMGKVMIVGAGPIGLMALRLCRTKGAERVYVSQPSTSMAKIKLAQEWGADKVIVSDRESLVECIKKLAPHGIDRILVTARLTQVLAELIGITAQGGKIVFVGVEWEKASDLKIPIDRFHFSKLQLIGSNHNPCVSLYESAAKLIQRKDIDTDKLITHRYPLSKIKEAFDYHSVNKKETIKVIIRED